MSIPRSVLFALLSLGILSVSCFEKHTKDRQGGRERGHRAELATRPENIDRLYQEAGDFYRKGKYREAKASMTRAYAAFERLEVKDKAKKVEYLRRLSVISLQLQENDKTIEYATEVSIHALTDGDRGFAYNALGIDYMIHHLLSHSDGRDWLKVNQFFMEQLAYLARKLDSIQEGDRTLLDNTMLMHCSSMMAGALHNNDQLPVILLGGAGGKLKGGRALDYTDKPERQLCRLFLSMMDKMDVHPETFGDAKTMLEDV
jgi:hypothetical protein